MAILYEDAIYIVMDELKIFSDDSVWENEHIASILNKYRALLIKQRYIDKKKEIPFAFYQRLTVPFDTKYSKGELYKSSKKLPYLIDNTNLWQYTFVHNNGISSQNLNFINPQRFKFVGNNKWLANETYVTIDLDNYMYVKSIKTDVQNEVNVSADVNNSLEEYYLSCNSTIPFDGTNDENQLIYNELSDGLLYYDCILDNPVDANSFNGINEPNFMKLEFPVDESLYQSIIELVLKEVGVSNQIQRDTQNNASDDFSLSKTTQQQQQQ